MTLSTCLFLSLNTVCLLILCFSAIASPQIKRDKNQLAAVAVLTLWSSSSIFITAAAWAAYWS